MNYWKTLLWITVCCFLAHTTTAEEKAYIIPSQTKDIKNTCLLLSGNWQFKYSPEHNWTTIQVPGEAVMQGFAIEHDKPFWYKKSFTIPSEYAGKQVILRFDGVYSHAKLMVNGKFVREHQGGFTRWETDVTPFVKPGKKNEIQLEVTDRLDEISYASGYAHHPIGGILRDVTIFALPKTHIYDFKTETSFNETYTDAILKIGYAAHVAEDAEIEFSLTDPEGKLVPMKANVFSLKKTASSFLHSLTVKNPLKWDAEHPNLYNLAVTIRKGNSVISSFEQAIGFREIKTEGDRLLVNGKPVKLRGACRHDIHPTLGRTTTAELDSLDAILFKKSNMNFVRTSHYPPSENFLKYCDQFGIYVECETAVCFVGTHRQKNYAPGHSHDDPLFADRYLGQFTEMVKSLRNHASIIMWSIGNESAYGSNFQQCWDWIKKNDLTRPAIFSYPGLVKNENKIYDILSMHYQDVYGNVDQYGITVHNYQGQKIPAIFDEWAHPACYTYQTLQDDPNIREFWGKSLDMMWSGLFAAPGGLGGGIWGYIDETFMIPKLKTGTSYWKEFARTAKPEGFQGECVGYGEWGIVDVWRRTKPEFWATQKAYSPVKILIQQINAFTSDEQLLIPIHNRFDHTNLNEVKITCSYNGKEKTLAPVQLEPHQKGILFIPGDSWRNGEKVLVSIFNQAGDLIDAEAILLGEEKVVFPETVHKGILSVDETTEQIIVKGSNFIIPFCKSTGLICNAISNGEVMIEKGPFLNMDINLNHLTGAEVRNSARKFIVTESEWQKRSLTWEKKEGEVLVKLSGMYQSVQTDMQIRIKPDGQMELQYITNGELNGYLRETGLKFYLPSSLNHLNWKRKGYWSYYPAGEFAGSEGETDFYQSKQVGYGEKPVQPWALDTRNYFYWADTGANCRNPLTQKAKGMKENIWYYTLTKDNQTGSGLSVISKDASVACRINKMADEQVVLYVNNRWDYPEIAWGNYCKTLEAVPNYGKITLQF